jgi:hypothetical protein
MHLPLAKRLAGGRDALEFPGMTPRHRRPHDNPVVLRDRLQILEAKIAERRA